MFTHNLDKLDALPNAWGNNYRNVTLQVGGVSEIDTIEYGHECRGTKTRERLRWRCTATMKATDPTSRQRGHPTSTNPSLSKIIK
jgi:hypothetical protein